MRLTLLLWTISLTAFAQQHASDPHWSYDGTTGPDHWGDAPGAATCKLGMAQSPIDLKGALPAKLSPIQFSYKPSALRIIDNGHTIQVNLDPGSSITVAGKTFNLVQFHFHRPSEEKINGQSADMVVHMVHADTSGKLAVVAVLLRKFGANQKADVTAPERAQIDLLTKVFSNIPSKKDVEVKTGLTINAVDLLPVDRGYYTFQGSLTTPPCSEGVTWFVLKNFGEMSPESDGKFGAVYTHNARPVQPLNGRRIQMSQ